MNATLNRSRLFSAYNVAKGMVADTGRLNRALGLSMRKEAPDRYTTTAHGCTCGDWTFRGKYTGQPCKHMLRLALVAVASDNSQLTDATPSSATSGRGAFGRPAAPVLSLVPPVADEDENPLKGLWS